MTAKKSRPKVTIYAAAEAAALAMPPMTDEAIAIVARVLATVEKRRSGQTAGPGRQDIAA